MTTMTIPQAVAQATTPPPGGAAQGARIHDLPNGERPRERLLQYGSSALSNAELIAILLRTGIEGESAIGIAQRMLARFDGLRGVSDASFAELSDVRGLSQAKYCQVAAGLELGRRLASLGAADRVTVDSPRAVADLLSSEMSHLSQEHLQAVLVNTKNQVVAVRLVYKGTVNTASVRTSEVLRPAVRENVPSLIVVHNHPSGDPTPSQQDVKLTCQLVAAAKLLDIDLLDHIIIGQQAHVSLRERGLGFEQGPAPQLTPQPWPG